MEGHPRQVGHDGEFWQNVHWRREWQTTSVFLPWEPLEQYEKAKRYDNEWWTLQVGRCPIWWDGWMASPTQWTFVWVNAGSWWWTGRPGVLQSTESKELDTTERLNWPTENDHSVLSQERLALITITNKLLKGLCYLSPGRDPERPLG